MLSALACCPKMVLYLRLGENIYTIRLNNEVLAVCDLCGWTREHILVNGVICPGYF